ncbi:Fe-S cluster assembly ATPase SufC [Prochlorococcus marinus]|uniref:Fe-S cluster assembly ATPase SufC n=1 Tax=Prochlorococcus marinus TaxID=1219 RepID=UPI0022B41AAB|nr:Fe-S cluster assembly ATPase SufC [Prochlorococcus marinus]
MTQKKIILELKDLHVGIEGKTILNGLNLQVFEGEIHAIMGRNGSGKSTLSKVIAGHPSYSIESGEILYEDTNISELEPEDRSKKGIFLGFQYPIEIPGVKNIDFLRVAVNAKRKEKNESELDIFEFEEWIEHKLEIVKMSKDFLERGLNQGFSGGEKKRNEILQMAILEPTLSILDETDSGLDIDALRTVANGINQIHSNNKATILITHYQRLLNEIQPHFVHIMKDGEIIKTGSKELAIELESKGYEEFENNRTE